MIINYYNIFQIDFKDNKTGRTLGRMEDKEEGSKHRAGKNTNTNTNIE